MAIELVCSCGRLVRFDKPPVGGQSHCPHCNAVLTIDNDRSIITDMPVADQAPESPSAPPPGAAPKPLWELMARHQSRPEVSEPPGAMTVDADYDSLPAAPATNPVAPPAGRKGLWSVMQTPGIAGAQGRHDEESASKVPGAGTDSIRIGHPDSPGLKSEIPNPKSEIASGASPPDALASMIGIAEDEGLLSARSKAAGFQAENSRRAVTAAVLGGLSIPLSGLAMINSGWSKLPATALGFVAILTGLIASQEIQRSGGRKTGRRQAMTGIVTGIIGDFLGPVVIAPLSRPRKGH